MSKVYTPEAGQNISNVEEVQSTLALSPKCKFHARWLARGAPRSGLLLAAVARLGRECVWLDMFCAVHMRLA